MELLRSIVLFVHLGTALLIIGLVLLQRGKGAEAGTGFGAGASGTVFGARGSASFLTRATAVLAAVFFMTSLTLVYFSNQQTEPTSIFGSLTEQEPGSTGATPSAIETNQPDLTVPEGGAQDLVAPDTEPGDLTVPDDGASELPAPNSPAPADQAPPAGGESGQ